jgi:hypothetical protein
MKTRRLRIFLIVLAAFLLFPRSALSEEPSGTRRPADLLADWIRKNGATDICAEMNRTRLAGSAYRALAKEFSSG